jgi:hypothetical protein
MVFNKGEKHIIVTLHHESSGNVTMDLKKGGRSPNVSKKNGDFPGHFIVQFLIEFCNTFDQVIRLCTKPMRPLRLGGVTHSLLLYS